jgi:hypothetical protein
VVRLSQSGALCGPPQLAHGLSTVWGAGGWRGRRGVDVAARGGERALAFIAVGFVLLMVSVVVERPAVGYPIGSVVSIEVAKLVSVSGGPYVVLLDKCLHVYISISLLVQLQLSTLKSGECSR